MLYSGVAGLAAVTALLRMLAYGAVLAPQELGYVIAAQLAAALATYPASLGILDALAREVPVRRGQGLETTGIRSSAVTAVAALSCVVGGVLALVWPLLMQDAARLALEAAFLTVATVVLAVATIDLQARERSVSQAALLLAKSAVPLALVSSLSRAWDAADVLRLEAGTFAVLGVLVLCFRNEGLHLRVRWRDVRQLTRLGMPFSLSNAVQHLAMNVDRWVLQFLGTPAQLGVYGFSMQVAAVGQVALNASQLYLTPRWLRAYAETGDRDGLLRKSRTRAWWTVAAGVLGLGLTLAILPSGISRWWPQYVAGVELLPWAAVAALLISLSYFDICFLAEGNGGPLVGVHAAGMVTAGLGCLAVAVLDGPLVAYAAAFGAGRLATLIVGWSLGVVTVARVR